MRKVDIAVFLSTSGHSGVDSSARLLIDGFLARGFQVDLVKIRKHGPYLDLVHLNYRCVEFKTKHTMSAIPEMVSYLKQNAPKYMLVDKDSANRVALIAKKLAKVTTKISVSSGTIMSINLQTRGWLDRQLHMISMNHIYPFAHSIITPSIDSAEDMANISTLDRSQISVVPLPIVSPETIARAMEPVDHAFFRQQDPVIISVGELSNRKNQATLIKAFAQYIQTQPAKLLILGKGREEQNYRDLIAQLNIEAHVDLVGFVKNPFAYMKRSDVFVHTALYEGFGMVLVEAMYLGIPVIASACLGGPREILQYGKMGELFPVGDHDALAKALKKTLAEPKDAETLHNSIQRYTVENSVSEYLRVMGVTD